VRAIGTMNAASNSALATAATHLLLVLMVRNPPGDD
jgi:hypothetical protein